MKEVYLIPVQAIFLILVPVISVASSEHNIGDVQAYGEELAPYYDQIVDYPSDFFERYKPNTALDMVRQVPGFQLDDGDSTRGFAAAAGNVLINGRRLSSKQDLPSATLARISSSQVERIELIRGQARGIDLRGQSIVVNIVLSDDVPTAIRWETFLQYNSTAPTKPGGNVSLSDRWRGVDYNTGFDLEADTSGSVTRDDILDRDRVYIERRTENSSESGIKVNGIYLNATSWWGDSFLEFNSKFNMIRSNNETEILRVPQLSGSDPNQTFIGTRQRNRQFELGAAAERFLSSYLAGKMIYLFSKRDHDPVRTQRNINVSGLQTLLRIADTRTQTTEGIARVEFDWAGLTDHAVQLNIEGAYNSLEGSLLRTDNTGAGPVVVNVPGANTRVQEYRGDFLLKDTWSLGQLELDYGLGAEVSTISQSGDAELERSFFFITPQASLSYSSGQGQQSRFRLAREVAQLNFNDFVSAVVLEDDELLLGNPNLSPDTTWVAELSHERRFDGISVVKVTLFHHWISNVMDLLPLTPIYAVPGNIGDGRRWGIELESTLPLEWLGLKGSKLDVKLRWQDSIVQDPVTGENRILSGQSGQGPYRMLTTQNKNNRYFVGLEYRQDFQAERIAWGWAIAERAERPLFKVNELDVYNESFSFNVFVETTRWFGIKSRLIAENIFNDRFRRDRTIFTGERNLTPVDYQVLGARQIGHRLTLTLGGNF